MTFNAPQDSEPLPPLSQPMKITQTIQVPSTRSLLAGGLALAGCLFGAGTARGHEHPAYLGFPAGTAGPTVLQAAVPAKQADWLSGVPSTRKLSELSLPGTHDTMAFYGVEDDGTFGVEYGRTQAMELKAQLKAGIRAIDIRLVINPAKTGFDIYHGFADQRADFESDVIEVCNQFLIENPTEFILMKISVEHADAFPGLLGVPAYDAEDFVGFRRLFVKLTTNNENVDIPARFLWNNGIPDDPATIGVNESAIAMALYNKFFEPVVVRGGDPSPPSIDLAQAAIPEAVFNYLDQSGDHLLTREEVYQYSDFEPSKEEVLVARAWNPSVGEMRGHIVPVEGARAQLSTASKSYGFAGTLNWSNTGPVIPGSLNEFAELHGIWELEKQGMADAFNGAANEIYSLSIANTGSQTNFLLNFFSNPYDVVNPYFVASGHSYPETGASQKSAGSGPHDLYPDFPHTNCVPDPPNQEQCDISYEGLNTLCYDYIRNWKNSNGGPVPGRLGIFTMDFPGPGLINEIISLNFPHPDHAAAVDSENLTWGTSGGADWSSQTVTTHDGVDAAQSGATWDSQSSTLQTSVTGPGRLTFWWKVSSEAGNDLLGFTVDGAPQASAPPISGSVDWQQKTVSVPAGSHTLRWTYSKNESLSVGTDAGWVDQVVFLDASVVLNTADSGPSSLRQAIADVPLAGDVITFAPELNGQTIKLLSELVVSKTLTIDTNGLAGGLTLSGGGTNRIFRVAGGGDLTLRGFALTGGNGTGAAGATNEYGGAIHSVGTLTLDRCTLSGNSAYRYGGAIRSQGNLTLTGCTLTGNTGSWGGAIQNEGSLTLSHCTVAGNYARSGGGGIEAEKASSNVTLTNTIVAGNNSPQGADFMWWQQQGTVAGSGCLIGNNATVEAQFPAMVPLIGTLSAPVDAKLSPLGDYGGPTQTMPPLADSPAIDPADGAATSALTTDQRGYPRVTGGKVDIGGVEAGAAITVANTNDSGSGSLRQALSEATTPGHRILFAPALSGQTILLTSSQLTVQSNRSVMIDASGLGDGITINGGGTHRGLFLDAGALAGIHGLTITGCQAGFGGGLGNGGGVLTLSSVTVSGNTSTGEGGGIWSTGRLSLTNCTVANNQADDIGGGISFVNATNLLTLVNSTIAGNQSATGGGGGIAQGGGTMRVTNCIVAGNTGPFGSDILNNNVTITTGGVNLIGDNSTVSSEFPEGPLVGTTAARIDPLLSALGHYGGPTQTMNPQPGSPAIDPAGAAAWSSLATDQRGLSRVLDGNVDGTATLDIGAVETDPYLLQVTTLADSGTGSLRKAIADLPASGQGVITFAPALSGQSIELSTGELAIEKNLTIDASNLGGGIVLDGTDNSRLISVSAGKTVTLKSLTLTHGDSSGSPGGGVFNEGILTMQQCTVSANQTTVAGGGVYNSATGTLKVNASTFADNRSASLYSSGGGIQNEGMLTVTQSTFTGNSANGGGAIGSAVGSLLTVEQCTLSGNEAGFSGGGISLYANTGSQTLVNSIVAGNTPNDLYLAGGPGFTTQGNNLTDRDPLLAPLDDYGGPTPTMPPLPGSPAIEGAVMLAGTPATDQRGAPRPSGPLPDLGAVEAVPFSSLTLADTDNDGIADILEGLGGPYPQFTVGVDDRALDSDGDGSPDAEELANMTHPNDATDKFGVLSFVKAAGFDPVTHPFFEVTVSTFPGLAYEFETSSDLGGFQPVVPDSTFTADDFTATFEVRFVPGPQNFVRAIRK